MRRDVFFLTNLPISGSWGEWWSPALLPTGQGPPLNEFLSQRWALCEHKRVR